MTPKTRRAALFYLGALACLASHGKVMAHAAMAAMHVAPGYLPSSISLPYLALVTLALTGSVMLVVSGWWQSVYRKRSAPLFTAILTGVTAGLASEAVRYGNHDAAWIALALVAVVLLAGLDSARAMRREISATRKA